MSWSPEFQVHPCVSVYTVHVCLCVCASASVSAREREKLIVWLLAQR